MANAISQRQEEFSLGSAYSPPSDRSIGQANPSRQTDVPISQAAEMTSLAGSRHLLGSEMCLIRGDLVRDRQWGLLVLPYPGTNRPARQLLRTRQSTGALAHTVVPWRDSRGKACCGAGGGSAICC